MTPAQLRTAIDVLGMSQAEAARQLKSDKTTIYRWLHGKREIPGPVEAAVHCWLLRANQWRTYVKALREKRRSP